MKTGENIQEQLEMAAWEGDRVKVLAAIRAGAKPNVKAVRAAALCNHHYLLDLVARPSIKVDFALEEILTETLKKGFYDVADTLLGTYPALSKSQFTGFKELYNRGLQGFLLEHGIEARISYYSRKGKDELQEAKPVIRAAIDGCFEFERKDAASLAWQAAAITGAVGGSQQEVEQAALAAIDDKRIVTDARSSLKGTAQRVGTRGYQSTYDCIAIAREYAETILLPRLLLDSGMAKKLDMFSHAQVDTLVDALLPIAGRIVFAGKPLESQLKLVASWKRSGNGMPDTLRPLRLQDWHPLIDTITTPFTYAGAPITIEALTSQEQLQDEGRRMGHCLGGGDHASSEAVLCFKGDARSCHLLSLRAGEHSLATATVYLENGHLRRALLEGPGRTPAASVTVQAYEWAMEHLGRNELLSIKEPAGGKWGAINVPDKKLPEIARRIGFYPTQMAVDSCLQHYREHLLIKEDAPKAADGASYKWRAAIDEKPLAEAIAKADADGRWQALVDELKAMQPKQRRTHARAPSVSATLPALP